jgi:hypothetical protein
MTKHIEELAIKRIFEPNRLSEHFLVDAYELLVPKLIKKGGKSSKKPHVVLKNNIIGENKL